MGLDEPVHHGHPDTRVPDLDPDATAEEPVDARAARGGSLHHRLVHQATGMVAVQVGVSAAEALTRLRTAAGAACRSLEDVAAGVVAREIRFHRRHLR